MGVTGADGTVTFDMAVAARDQAEFRIAVTGANLALREGSLKIVPAKG